MPLKRAWPQKRTKLIKELGKILRAIPVQIHENNLQKAFSIPNNIHVPYHHHAVKMSAIIFEQYLNSISFSIICCHAYNGI